MIKISVIIPVYNIEKHLRECLDSVIHQTFKDIEIICINDGSTDNSLQILNEYATKDSRFIIINQENQSQGVARNKGIDIAKGEYITFIDSDDYFISFDVLEKMIKKIKSNNYDFVMFKGKVFSNYSTDLVTKRMLNLKDYLDFIPCENLEINLENFGNILDNYPCVTWGGLYNTNFLKSNNIKNINKKITQEDNGFFIKLCSSFPKCCFIDEFVIMYRVGQVSTMSEVSKKRNKQKSDSQLKEIIEDCITHIKKYNSLDTANKLIKQILLSDRYSSLYEISWYGLFTYKMGKNEQRIRMLGFPIWRKKIRNKKLIIEVFGIPVYIKDLTHSTVI